MSTDLHDLPDDPFGYRQQLADALADPDRGAGGVAGDRAALRILFGLGRCVVYGVEARVAPEAALPVADRDAAVRELMRQLPGWTESARTLDRRWYEVEDPWEADELCAGLVELRTDLLGAESVYAAMVDWPAAVRESLETFDAALAEQLLTLGTLAGSTWLDNYWASLAPQYRESPPWWLGAALEDAALSADQAADASLPSAASRAATRVAAWWKALFPSLEPGLLHGETAQEQPAVPTQALRWWSLDGRYFAQLNVPATSSHEADAESRPLCVMREADGESAVELAGEPIALGEFRGVLDAEGKAWVTLAELRDVCDGQLKVGRPPLQWLPNLEEDQ